MLKLEEKSPATNVKINKMQNKNIHSDVINNDKRISVMVVEDEKEHNELIKFILDKKGYKVISFDNATEALDYLTFEHVDIIVSDVMMPNMDGLEFCTRVKKDFEDIYFILLTARSEIKDKLTGFNLGADEYIVKPFDIMEFVARVQAGERIVTSKKKLASLNHQLELIADTDSLTQVKNRRFFNNVLSVELDRSSRYRHTLALLMIDIDFFKKVNDKYGHLAGDYVLKKMSKLIYKSLRTSDYFCRYGGEEFVVLLPETNPKLAFQTAEKIRRLVEKCIFEFDGKIIDVTVSIGIVIKTPNNVMDAKTLICHADKAMYRAKTEGRNKTVIYKWYNINDLQAVN